MVEKNIWDTDELIVTIDDDDDIYFEQVNCGDGILLTAAEIVAFSRHFLDLQGYDVVKREPELKPCPFCGMKAEQAKGYVRCTNDDCSLIGPDNDPDGKKWNVLPRKGE